MSFLPEERTQDFLSLTVVSIASGMKTIQEPTLEDNTFIFAINDIAQYGIDIAQCDSTVKHILEKSKAK